MRSIIIKLGMGRVGLYSLCCRSVSQSVVAHVLQNLLAVVVLVCTRVLVGPLDGEDGTFVVVEASDVVATTVVVLRVEKSVGIVPVSSGLI